MKVNVQRMVGLGGLEPPTSPLSGLTPIHLGAWSENYKFLDHLHLGNSEHPQKYSPVCEFFLLTALCP